MPSRRRGALSEFRQSVHRVTSTKSFNEKFQSYCQKCDRHEMIKILMDIEEVKRLRVAESYHEKDEAEARKIYEKYRSIIAQDVSSRGTLLAVNFLTKALFAACPTNPLFKEILLERAGCWYSIGSFARCGKDCDYLMTVLSDEETPSRQSQDFRANDEINIECTELRAKCNERLKRLKRESHRPVINKSSMVTMPRIDGRPNAKMPSCADSVCPRYEKTRGRHLVATRNLKIGSVIMIDEPFSYSTDSQALRTNCLHCHVSLDHDDNVRIPCHNCQTVAYCSNDCRRDSWLDYHRYECEIFDYFYETNVRDIDLACNRQHKSHLLLAWRTTVVAAVDRSTNRLNEQFMKRQVTMSNEEMGTRENDLSIDPYDPHDYRTVFALETHCSDSSIITNLARSLRAVFLAKCLNLVLSKNRMASSTRSSIDTNDLSALMLLAVGILRHMQSVDCNAYEIVENRRDETTRIWEPRNVGGAIYTTVSLINHACYPNVIRHSYPNGKVVVRALRFISKGTEILDCYGPHFVSDASSSRRRFLQDKFHFTCMCEACVNNYHLADDTSTIYKCTNCATSINEAPNKCAKCNRSNDTKKLQSQLAKSLKKRLTAAAKMYEGNYADALPILVEHGNLIDKILAEPSLEAIKTQQSIVQCWNGLSSVSPSIRSSV